MNAHQHADFAVLRSALPPLEPDTELILRPETDLPLAMLRPVGAPPRTFVLEGGVVFELMPHNDPKLPAASLLGDPRRMCRKLAPFLGPVSEPVLIAWRPAKRAVVRVRCADGKFAFVKFLDKKTYAKAETTFGGLMDAGTPLHFARPQALIPDFFGYVALGVPGRSLRDLLATNAQIPWDLLLTSILALRNVPPIAGSDIHDFASARKASSNMLRKASFQDPRLAALAAQVDAIAAPPLNFGFVHGDLHDKQIFVHGYSTHLIDLEGVGQGDPLFDLANLAEHMRLRALQQTGDDDGSADALLVRAGLTGDLQLRWRVIVRARLAGVYALRPRWQQLTDRLIIETILLLNDLR
ncbi:hypothetical protein LBMAG49_00230 [Planctomycetota bacterium]|nr:hypothetical protein LBMAG49_00230 [Planctomycetota bacterium]